MQSEVHEQSFYIASKKSNGCLSKLPKGTNKQLKSQNHKNVSGYFGSPPHQEHSLNKQKSSFYISVVLPFP